MKLPMTTLVDETAGDKKQDGRQDQRRALRPLTFSGTLEPTSLLAASFWYGRAANRLPDGVLYQRAGWWSVCVYVLESNATA